MSVPMMLKVATAAFDNFHHHHDVPASSTAEFHRLINDVATRCSRSDVQKCREWLLRQGTLTNDKTGGTLAPYLAALADTFVGDSARKRRMHLLYMVNELLHHIKFQAGSHGQHERFMISLPGHLHSLVASTSGFPSPKYLKTHEKLNALLGLWESKAYFPPDIHKKLRDAAQSANGNLTKSVQEDHFIMPAEHGDQSVSFYDWPAAAILPNIKQLGKPVSTSNIRPQCFKAGPAEEKLADAVKNILKEADRLFDPTYAADASVEGYDQMGHALIRDSTSGRLIPRETYFGWSVEFCEKMKRRDRERAERREQERIRARQRERDEATRRRDRSLSQQRRGYSSDMSLSRSVSRERPGRDRKSRSPSPSRSPSQRRYRSRSHSTTHSRSPRRGFRGGRDPYSRHSRSSSRLSDEEVGSYQNAPAQSINPVATPGFPPPPIPGFPFPPPPPLLSGRGFPANFPIPPPPPGHTGPWPPPPPPLLPPPNLAGQANFPPFPPHMIPPNIPGFGNSQSFGNFGTQGSMSRPDVSQNSSLGNGRSWNGHRAYSGGRGNWQDLQHHRGRGRGSRY